MEFTSLRSVLEDQLKDLYSAENQLVKALPKMAKAASSDSLREAIESHLEETKNQVERLDQISEKLSVKLTGKKCAAMEGLIEEGKEVLDAKGEDVCIDICIVAAAQRVEHYEISAYGTARTLAEELGEDEVASLLEETLNEESATDEKLTQITEDELLAEAISSEEEQGEEEEEEEEEEPARPSR